MEPERDRTIGRNCTMGFDWGCKYNGHAGNCQCRELISAWEEANPDLSSRDIVSLIQVLVRYNWRPRAGEAGGRSWT